jgi:hypothetical protein
MRNATMVAAVLFVLHTIDEISSSFWQSDLMSLAVSGALHITPLIVYGLVQIILYAFLATIILLPLKKGRRFWYGILGLILLFEFQHLLAAISGAPTSGLFTGLALSIFAIYFWVIYIKNLSAKTI